MVKPIHLQDNFGKTLAAQRVVDQMIEGEARIRYLNKQIINEQLERIAREQTEELEEKTGLPTVNPEGRRRHAALKKEKKKSGEEDDQDTTWEDDEAGPGLRKRRNEDDKGKGSKLDIQG